MKHLKWLFFLFLFFSVTPFSYAQNCHPEDSIAIYDLRDGLGLQSVYPGHIATWNVGSDIDTITDPFNPAQFRITNIFFSQKVSSPGSVTLRDSLFVDNRLRMVQNFIIDNNFISSIEQGGGGMANGVGFSRSLKQIDLSNNEIATYPDFFTDMMDDLDSLELFIASNALNGPSVPLSSFSLSPKSFLFHFDISNNNFSGTLNVDLIGSLANYPKLKFLYADDNPFDVLQAPISSASFSPVFQKLSIQGLLLQDFQPIETLLNAIPSIQWLFANNTMDTTLVQNNIAFNITSNLPNLKILDLSNNLLPGPFPIQLFENLSNLETLYVNNNRLNGPLPTPSSTISGGPFSNQQAYQGTRNLKTLDLSNNALGGKLRLDWILAGMLFDNASNNGDSIPLIELHAQHNSFNEIRPRLEEPALNQLLGVAFDKRFSLLRRIDVSNNALDFKDLFRLRRIFRFAHNGVDYYANSGIPGGFQYADQAEIGIGGVRRQRSGKSVTIKAGSGIVARENGGPINYISNNYLWERIDTSGIAGGTPILPYTETIAAARQINGSTISNFSFNNTGIATTIPTYIVGVNQTTTDPDDLHKIAITNLDVVDHGDWLYRAVITNDSFPDLTLFSVRKKVEVGGCKDDSGADVWCQSMIVQFHPDTLAAYPPEKHDSLKRAIRESIGATAIETCLCGDIELWGVSDTAASMLEAFGKGTRNSATTLGSKPQLLSADPNYNLLAGNASTLPDTVNLPAGSGNSTATTLVAIIDSGIDYEYSPLTPYISEGASNDSCLQNAVWGFNFVDENNNATDDHGHGTAVAGIVAGISQQSILPDVGQADIAILPLKYTNKKGEGSLFNAACAIRYAADYSRTTATGEEAKVRVINASWGYYGDPCIVLEDVIQYSAEECDILFVAAAGNDGSIVEGNDSLRHWPSNSIWDTSNTIDEDHVLSVAGTASNNPDMLDDDSNWGSIHIDVAAPWVDVAPQAGSVNGFATVEGTSFATPQVSRAAALLFEKHPDAKYWAVKYALKHGVDTLQSLDSLKISSRGRINYQKADSILNIITNRTVCTPSITINLEQIIELQEFINIYPNPVGDQLTIDMDFDLSAEALNISLFNLQGQLLQHQELPVGTTNTNLNTGELPSGVYFVRIQLDNQQYSMKVIKH